jgi:hypothetical protein
MFASLPNVRVVFANSGYQRGTKRLSELSAGDPERRHLFLMRSQDQSGAMQMSVEKLWPGAARRF